MSGFKVFKSVIPIPGPHLQVSTRDHPVQSFLWDDFTGKPDHVYEYTFQPLRGKPKNLDRSAKPVTVKVRTEPLFTKTDHDVFFNRGVASSQAYERLFGNKKPDEQPTKAKQKEALDWLTRDLDEAIEKFIASAGSNDTLLCSFYDSPCRWSRRSPLPARKSRSCGSSSTQRSTNSPTRMEVPRELSAKGEPRGHRQRRHRLPIIRRRRIPRISSTTSSWCC